MTLSVAQSGACVQNDAPASVSSEVEVLPLAAQDQEPASAQDAHPRSFSESVHKEHANEAAHLRHLLADEVRLRVVGRGLRAASPCRLCCICCRLETAVVHCTTMLFLTLALLAGIMNARHSMQWGPSTG